MRSMIRPVVLAATVLIACGGISGCSNAPEPATGKVTGPMDRMETGKTNGGMDKMEGHMDNMEKAKAP